MVLGVVALSACHCKDKALVQREHLYNSLDKLRS